MSDYNLTRSVAGQVVTRFASMLKNLEDECSEEETMSHWHYQLMYHKYDKLQLGEEGYYAIHEYYEMTDGPAWTENPVDVTGNSVEDVKKALMLMLHDIDKHGVKDYDED